MSCIFTYIYGNAITEKQTADSYSMIWKEISENGGTVYGTWGGPMKDGKRDGVWKADVKFNLFGDAPTFRTGTMTMTRSYKNGIPDGAYKYTYNINYRDGHYNRLQNKWIYETPTNYEESTTGSFKKGKPNGQWNLFSNRGGYYKATVNFAAGVPVGEYISTEDIIGDKKWEFDQNGFLKKIYIDITNNNGIEYPDLSELPEDMINTLGASNFFSHPVYNEVNSYFAKGGDFAQWLLIYPWYASEDEPLVTAKRIKQNKETIAYEKPFGTESYVSQYLKEQAEKKRDVEKDKIYWNLSNIIDSLNNISFRYAKNWSENSKEMKTQKFSFSGKKRNRENFYANINENNKKSEWDDQTPSPYINITQIISNRLNSNRIKFPEIFLQERLNPVFYKNFYDQINEFVQRNPEIEQIKNGEIIDEMKKGEDYHQRNIATDFMLFFPDNIQAQNLEKDYSSLLSEASKDLKKYIIRESDFENLLKENIMAYYYASKNPREWEDSHIEFSKPNDSNKYQMVIKTVPSYWDEIILQYKSNNPKTINSINEINFTDFILYCILEMADVSVSQEQVTIGGYNTKYKYKIKSLKKYPTESEIIEIFSQLKSKMPLNPSLDNIYVEYQPSNGKNNITQSLKNWVKNIGEDKIEKEWKKFAKNYKLEI